MIDRIYNAYQGEVYGIAFFTYFSERYSILNKNELWNTLINVEILTAQLLEPTLTKHKVPFDIKDQAMLIKGTSDAKKWIHLEWNELVNTLTHWVEPYEVKYREWAAEATKEMEAFQLIADHETAIYECWKAELNQQSGLPILLSFIEKYRQR
ncbi:hypothetical protein [Aliivibrio fischeri]|uniref:hypothetical protein n=1 Tax=Aliivibrio fischeri TaxID=668 RepID=UPI0037353AC6